MTMNKYYRQQYYKQHREEILKNAKIKYRLKKQAEDPDYEVYEYKVNPPVVIAKDKCKVCGKTLRKRDKSIQKLWYAGNLHKKCETSFIFTYQ
jgi:hypothetical protein